MKIKSLVRSALSFYYLTLVVLSIPLAFDAGGNQCGLAYLLALLAIYFVLTTLRLLSRRVPFLRVVSLLYYAQHLFIPSILTWFVHFWSHNDVPEFMLITTWKWLLVHATLVFTIAEGFCLLLLIQAISQTLNWLTVYKSDSWLFVSLIGLGTTMTGALYFLYRIYVYPFPIELGNASLMGSFLTITLGLSLYGILSGKGSMIESSLLFAYIVRCIYETFPPLSEDASQTFSNLLMQTTVNLQKEMNRLPYPFTKQLHNILPFLTSNLPLSLRSLWEYLVAALHKLSLSLLTNLVYRIGVFYAATKIIPSLYNGLPYSPPRTPQLRSRQTSSSSISSISTLSDDLKESPSPVRKQPVRRLRLSKSKLPSTILTLIYAYSPCIIIAVFSHLMLLYGGELGTELKLWGWWESADENLVIVVHPWQFWNWVNMATTLFLYMAELISNDGLHTAMTSHWKVD